MDTSKNTIVMGILMSGGDVAVIDRIWNEEGLCGTLDVGVRRTVIVRWEPPP